MAGLASYKRLVAAGDHSVLSARGILVVLRNSQGAIRITTIQNQLSDKSGTRYSLILRRGEKWTAHQEFDGLDISNDSDKDQLVELLVGYGDYVEPPPDIATADFFQGLVPSDCTHEGNLIAAVNEKRKRITLKAKVENIFTVYIAGTQADAQAGNGLPLGPGDTYTGEARGELWGGCVESGGDGIIFAIEENFSVPAAP